MDDNYSKSRTSIIKQYLEELEEIHLIENAPKSVDLGLSYQPSICSDIVAWSEQKKVNDFFYNHWLSNSRLQKPLYNNQDMVIYIHKLWEEVAKQLSVNMINDYIIVVNELHKDIYEQSYILNLKKEVDYSASLKVDPISRRLRWRTGLDYHNFHVIVMNKNDYEV